MAGMLTSTMHLQSVQNPARGHSISLAVSPAPCTSVRVNPRPERHYHKGALRSPIQGQMLQTMKQGKDSQGMRLNAASMEMAEPKSSATKVEWYKKKKELWIEADDVDGLKAVLENNDTGKPMVVDLYAGWCSSCKTAYPALCKVL